MNYNESSEDYLEAILMLREQLGKVRSIDIVYKDGYITLTDEGLKIARHTYTRHKVLTSFFENIGVNPRTAEDDACKIEHDISEETFKRLREFMSTNEMK